MLVWNRIKMYVERVIDTVTYLVTRREDWVLGLLDCYKLNY